MFFVFVGGDIVVFVYVVVVVLSVILVVVGWVILSVRLECECSDWK